MRPFLNPPEERAKSHHSLLGPQGPMYHRHTGLDCEALHLPIDKTPPPSGHRLMSACSPQQLTQCPPHSTRSEGAH